MEPISTLPKLACRAHHGAQMATVTTVKTLVSHLHPMVTGMSTHLTILMLLWWARLQIALAKTRWCTSSVRTRFLWALFNLVQHTSVMHNSVWLILMASATTMELLRVWFRLIRFNDFLPIPQIAPMIPLAWLFFHHLDAQAQTTDMVHQSRWSPLQWVLHLQPQPENANYHFQTIRMLPPTGPDYRVAGLDPTQVSQQSCNSELFILLKFYSLSSITLLHPTIQ